MESTVPTVLADHMLYMPFECSNALLYYVLLFRAEDGGSMFLQNRYTAIILHSAKTLNTIFFP
jgi:hypothetical protein